MSYGETSSWVENFTFTEREECCKNLLIGDDHMVMLKDDEFL